MTACGSSVRMISSRRDVPSSGPIPRIATHGRSSTSRTATIDKGGGGFYQDDVLFGQGLEAVDRAIALAPSGRLVVEDSDLQMKSADELRAELEAGMKRDVSDLNPVRAFQQRK